MENAAENLEKQRQEFIGEIKELKEEEEKTGKTVHFPNINPEELTLEDAEYWSKIKDGSIIEEDLKNYRDKLFLDKELHPREDVSKSRIGFFAYINNRASIIFLQREYPSTKQKS